MGCGTSVVVHHHHHRAKFVQNHVPLDGVISPKDMPMFYEAFNKIDANHDGKMDIKEFLDHLDLPRNSPIGHRVFGIMSETDEAYGSEIDFATFANAVFDFCAFGEDQLIEFALRIIDRKGEGKIKVADVKHLLTLTCGKVPLQSQVKGIILELDKKNRGYIDMPTWINYMREHPSMAFAAFQMQQRLRAYIGGKDFWEAQKSSIQTKHSERLVGRLQKMSQRYVNREIQHIEKHAEDHFRKMQREGKLDSLGRPTKRGTRRRQRKKKSKGFGKKRSHDPRHQHIHHHHHSGESAHVNSRAGVGATRAHSDAWVSGDAPIPAYENRIHTTGYG